MAKKARYVVEYHKWTETYIDSEWATLAQARSRREAFGPRAGEMSVIWEIPGDGRQWVQVIE